MRDKYQARGEAYLMSARHRRDREIIDAAAMADRFYRLDPCEKPQAALAFATGGLSSHERHDFLYFG